jgi:hypothetical protein
VFGGEKKGITFAPTFSLRVRIMRMGGGMIETNN